MQRANQCRVELERGTIIATPVRNLGELDSDLFAADVDGILGLLMQRRARNLIFDLSRTEFFGSDAIHLFLRLHRGVRESGGRMAFCHASGNEREVLTLMALDTLWPIFSSRSDALDFVAEPSAEILVVDDSEVDRRLVGGLLTGHGDYSVRYADSGESALTQMQVSIPDVIITDLVMPEMDGLELVANVRRLYPLVPVILLTAHGNETIAFEALERGAASYVPKSKQAEILVETVGRVLSRRQASCTASRLQGCPAKIDCRFHLVSHPATIRPTVDLIQHNLAAVGTGDTMEQIRIGIALEEALLNAIYHGNLELSSHELATAVRESSTPVAVDQLVTDRTRRQSMKNRQIVMDVHITSHTARFVIRDEGPGFDRTALAQPANRCFELGENRGTMLMCALMDEVLYNEAGNQVTLIKVP